MLLRQMTMMWMLCLAMSTAVADDALKDAREGMKSRDAKVRLAAIKKLHRVRGSDTAKLVVIKKGLRDTDHDVRLQALMMVSDYGKKTAAPYLRKALKDRNPRSRSYAVKRLCRLLGKDALRDVLRLKSDRERTVRSAVVSCLGSQPVAVARRHLGVIEKMLSDEDGGWVRYNAVSVYARVGQPSKVIARLSRMAKTETYSSVLRKIYTTLGTFDDPRAVAAIEAGIDHKEYYARMGVLGAIDKIVKRDPERCSAWLARLLGDTHKYVVRDALKKVGRKLDSKEIRKAVMDMARGAKDTKRRQDAIAALRNLCIYGSPAKSEIVDFLKDLSNDKEVSIRQACINGLHGRVDDLSFWEKHLSDGDRYVRASVVWCIKGVGGVAAAKVLEGVLEKDGAVYVRRRAADMLGELGLARSRKALEKAAKGDGETDVRKAAAKALKKLK